MIKTKGPYKDSNRDSDRGSRDSSRDTGRGGYSRYDQDDGDDDGGNGKRPRKFSSGNRAKKCRFTTGEEEVSSISYKNPKFLASFLTEHGKIVPRRVTGNAAHIQRTLTQEIKRARQLGLLGYTSVGPSFYS